MSELKLISPMLDNFMVGDAINEREGLRTYPAMRQDTEEKYIIKVISIPSKPEKLDALVLSGAYKDLASALSYYRGLADEIVSETETLKHLSELEGFLAFEDCQIVENDDGKGYDVYLLSSYNRSLERHFQSAALTHLAAANLGLDLCAALTVARRAGYLYADLRPDNIYITNEGEYKIGDIGFIRLDGIKYAAMPDRYRSPYTAPEAIDAYAAPSETMDVYALGLILYQIYNNNQLPTPAENGDILAAPQYADYELSEIILKACAATPEDRWPTPVEMGRAIVSYMQRNGISDDPIIPIPTVDEPVSPDSFKTDTNTEAAVVEVLNTTENIATPEETQTDYVEDDFGNLSFLEDAFTDNSPEETVADNYDQLSGEVTEILEQADDLAAHEVPDPVVAPEAVDVPIPVIEDEENVNLEETQAVSIPGDVPQEVIENAEESADACEPQDPPKRKKRKWLRNSIIILAVLAVLAICAYFFIGYYFVPIDDLRIEGHEDKLIVYVDTQIDESLLEVECSFPEGTPITANVKDGKAVFTGLTHNTGYSIKVRAKGFHRLTGESSTAYSTPVQTSLLHFSATTGMTDGSVVLTFSVSGPESEEWTITYWAQDEPENSVTFPNHTITLDGLTVGKQYTFRLHAEDDLYLAGDWEIQATASKLIYAQDITITEFTEGTLSAVWSAPEESLVGSWTVRCYNDQGYSSTAVVEEPSVTFSDVKADSTYNIEIVAPGMTDSARAYAYPNSINIKDFTATPQSDGTLFVNWSADRELPEGSWITYSIDGYNVSQQFEITDNSVVIPNYVPGAKHVFTISSPDGDHFVGAPLVFTADDAESFTSNYYNYVVNAEHMDFMMCRTPSSKNWNVYYLYEEDYTSEFSVGEKASFLVHLNATPGYSEDVINILYVIRNADGAIVDIATDSSIWFFLWQYNYGTFDIPALPQDPGNYTIDVFFNGASVASQDFSVN